MVNEMKNRFKVNKPCTRALKFINFNKRYFLINCIIDSGSSLNLINMNCPIMHDNRVNIMNDRMNLSAAFGGSQTVLGFVHFRLQIEQSSSPNNFTEGPLFDFLACCRSSVESKSLE